MKRTNKWMAMALAGIMMVGMNASSVFATDALTIKENTRSMLQNRMMWSSNKVDV